MANAIDYTKVNWKDFPNTETPVNAANLNKMDKGIDDLNAVATALQVTTADHQTRILQLESYKTSSTVEINNIKNTYATASSVEASDANLNGKIDSLASDLNYELGRIYPAINTNANDIDSIKAVLRSHGWM